MITLPAHFPIKWGTRPTMAASGGQARKERGHSVQTALTLMARMPLGGGNVGQAVQKVRSKVDATVFNYEIFSSICNLLQYPAISECVGYDSTNSWPPPPCIFPFVYEGFNHTGCLKDCDQNGPIGHSHTDLPKDCNSEHGCCPTKLDDDGKPSVWGSCNSACQTSSK